MINNNNNGGGAPMEAGIASQKAVAANQGGLKKGPWTAAEDAILIDYVKKYGEGNWNSVQKNSGLMRCGKSCRLRWANHLRPNLKKGSFTPEEERIIIELHAKLGNKWARMASQLPGRTDNEIKNFWNTRMKRRQRAGLPVYPQELQEAEASGFHNQQHQHSHDHQQKHQSNISSSSSSFSSLLSSSRKASYNPSLSLLAPAVTFSPSSLSPLRNHRFTSFYSTPTLHLNSTNTSLALPSSNIPPFNHQNFALQTIPSLNYINNNTTSDFETNNTSFTSLIMGSQVEPIGLIPDLKSELPSDQTPPYPNTPSGDVCVGNNNDNDNETNRNNSGLLDALLFESHNLSRKEKFICENSVVAYDKGKRVMEEPIEEKEKREEDYENKAFKRGKLSSINGGEASCENHCCDDLSSSQSSIGMKPREQEQIGEMNPMDDDYLFSLLANFPSSTPLPEWYRRRNISDGLSSDTIGGDSGDGGGVQVKQETSMADHSVGATATATNDTPTVEWTFESSYWNNMPSIC